MRGKNQRDPVKSRINKIEYHQWYKWCNYSLSATIPAIAIGPFLTYHHIPVSGTIFFLSVLYGLNL